MDDDRCRQSLADQLDIAVTTLEEPEVTGRHLGVIQQSLTVLDGSEKVAARDLEVLKNAWRAAGVDLVPSLDASAALWKRSVASS